MSIWDVIFLKRSSEVGNKDIFIRENFEYIRTFFEQKWNALCEFLLSVSKFMTSWWTALQIHTDWMQFEGYILYEFLLNVHDWFQKGINKIVGNLV